MIEDDLAELEAKQEAKVARRRRIRLWALYVAVCYVALGSTAVESVLPARSIVAPFVLALVVAPAWLVAVGWGIVASIKWMSERDNDGVGMW